MKNIALRFMIVILIILCGCSDKQSSTYQETNKYISSFTSGTISRTDKIQISFSYDIPLNEQSPELLQKSIVFTPEITGSFSILDNSLVVLTPDKPLKPNTEYKVRVNVGAFFKTDKEDRSFQFAFRTISPEISFQFKDLGIEVTADKDTLFDISGTILTADKEDSAVVHQLLDFDKEVVINWNRPLGNKEFSFRALLKKKFPKGEFLRINVKSNKYGYPKEEIAKVSIPDASKFTVYDIRTSPGEEDHDFEVIFTRNLDPEQDLTGLVEVSPSQDVSFRVVGNKLKIWIADKSQTEHTVRVHDGIRADNGSILAEPSVDEADAFSRTLSLTSDYPDLQFIGEGGILPVEAGTKIPFSATSLRGIIVRVIRVFPNNMGEFLQFNNMDGDFQLAAVGKLLCRRLLFLDESGHYNLNNKNTFALDLKSFIEPEPGAMYRILLSYNESLSAYPCSEREMLSKKELLRINAAKEEEEMSQFGNGSAYYYFEDQGWNGYRWDERDMPCKSSYYVNRIIGKNVLSSNLGIMAKRGEGDKLFVTVNNIATAHPEDMASVSVYDFQHQLIAERSTWENGTAEFSLNGQIPYYLIVKKKGMYGYLRMDPSQALSLSSFDVSGQEVRKGIKGFIYLERGVWRPGDTLHTSFILNGVKENIPKQHPVTFELYNPSGQLFHRETKTSGVKNFYTFPCATSVDSPTGAWRVRISVGGASFEKIVRIETIKPNRLSIDLHFSDKLLERGKEESATLKSRWLTGALASSLRYDITGTFIPMKTEFVKFREYVFDDPTRSFSDENVRFAAGITNKEGEANVSGTLNLGEMAAGMLKAQFVTKVYEESGEFSLDANQIPYSPFMTYAGICSPQQGDVPLKTGKEHTFKIASVSPQGEGMGDQTLIIRIFKLEWYWWWNQDNSQLANYISSGYNKPIKQMEVRTDKMGTASFNLSFPKNEWGSYYVQVSCPSSGHQTGVMTYFDSADEINRLSAGTDKAVVLSLSSDRKEYRVGEEVEVSFPSTAESRAIVTIEGQGGVLSHYELGCDSIQTTFKFKTTQEMVPNVYVGVTLLNPYRSTLHDLPIRMYGVTPILVNSPDSHVYPEISGPAEIRPNQEFSVKISEKNGKPLTYTLAVVDEGLLDLTHFKTPSPWEAFNAREALGIRTWDMYNYVLGAYGGKIEHVFSIGGDDALLKGPKAIVNRFPPVVIFKGPYSLGKGESQSVAVKMPNYIGKVRCMVIAGNETGFGNAQKSITVTQPLMVLGSLPRVLAPGDEIEVPITIFALKENVGEVTIRIKGNEYLSPVKPELRLTMNTVGNQVVWVPVKVNAETGTGALQIEASNSQYRSEWNARVNIESPLRAVMETRSYEVAKGEELKIEYTPFGLKNSNTALLEVSTIPALNLQNRMEQLSQYPYSCLEQVISRIFPYLYLREIHQYSTEKQREIRDEVKRTMTQLKSYQMPEGSFSYWPGGTSSNGWGSVYATHFLLKAEEAGMVLPAGILQRSIQYQSALAKGWESKDSPQLAAEELTQAYRLYVLAKANSPERGAMNRLRERAGVTGTARWLLAGAYIYIGRDDIARSIIEQQKTSYSDAGADLTFGSLLRDEGIRLIVLSKLGLLKQALPVAEEISKVLSSQQGLNTQETAFALMGIGSFYKTAAPASELNFDVNKEGRIRKVDISAKSWSENVSIKDGVAVISVRNRSNGTLFIQCVQEGIPGNKEQKAFSNGISINQQFYNAQDKPISIDELMLGTDFKVITEIKSLSALPIKDIMVDQPVPGGWEILNTRYMFSNNSDSLSTRGISHQDIRDSRIESYIPELRPGGSIRMIIYLNASYCGKFFLPASQVKAMYNETINANTKGMPVNVIR